MYRNLFHTRSLKQRLLLLGKKVEAILKSAWTEKDQTDNFLKERREAKTTSTPTSPTTQAQVTYVSESVSYAKFKAKTFVTWKEVEAILKSAWTEKDQTDNFLKERSDEVLKLKNFKKDALLKLFKLSNQEREDTNQQSPPPIAPPEAPQVVSSVKHHILKKGEYILWTMKMEQYLAHTDYALWEVILNGNGEVQMTKDKASEHLARFHGIKDDKTLWAAIKTIFGGNAEYKKMQKNILKQQFEIFSVSNSEGLDKGYDRFQRLLSLLEIHGAGVSTKDAN
nr:hypothetical protein [Tanacetum cinerariifolium]